MIDLHSHVLPGIDDGPADAEASSALLGAMAAAGMRRVIATPHVSEEYANTPETIAAALAVAAPLAAAAGVELDTGAEVTIEQAAALDDESLSRLRLGGGPWLLVECPLSPAAADFDRALAGLRARGFRLVLAHPERSPALQRDPGRVLDYVVAGDLTAVTAGAMEGRFGRTARGMCVHLFLQGLVHAVTSDAHDLRGRPPGLLEGFAALEAELPGIAEHADWHTDGVPAAILAGTPLPPPPPVLERAEAPRRRRRLFGRGR